MQPTEISYDQALKSFDSLASNSVCNGGRALIRQVLKIGLAEGLDEEGIVQDIANRLHTSREDVVKALTKRRHPRLYAVPVPPRIKLIK